VEQVRAAFGRWWSDADRRRALLLSFVAHLCALLLFVLWLSQPRPVPLEQFLVIDLSTPEQGERPVEAATVADAAPTAPTPQVADQNTGEPQARSSDTPEDVAPEPQFRTQQPAPQPLPQPQRQEVAEQPAPQERPVAPEAPARSEAPIAPAPRVRQPEPEAAAPDLPQATVATVLPEIEEVELEPRPAAQAVNIPQPQAAARIPEARTVAVTPAVQVAAAREVPVPRTSAEVAEAEPLAQPDVRAQVAGAVPIPLPGVAATVPQASPVPRPGATANVAAAVTVPVPTAAAEVAASRQVPLPSVQTQVAEARPVTVAAQVAVSRPVTVPTPTVRAQVIAPVPAAGAPLAGAAPAGDAPAPSNRLDDRRPGGNSDRTAQDRAADDAQAGDLGRAADTGEGEATGAQTLRPQIPYREERERPLAVLLDNVRGYPQSGLPEATLIAEMPVEGGLTRLLALYDQRDPGQVGPIRSARDYFVELAYGYDGILVHDGGSPAALAAIDRGPLPTLNAYRFGDLFSRQQERAAPYNLYSSGVSLREAVNRLRLDRSLEVRGVVPRPPETAPEAQSVEVRFGADYRSGFSYIRELDIYRWRRNGENAVDARGEAIYVEAVLLARVEARPIPDDPAARLYIPLRGGEATLFLRGRAITGRWLPAASQGQGVSFVAEDGRAIDLAPFRLWLLFAPGNAQVAAR
jgi:hypothetical protein